MVASRRTGKRCPGRRPPRALPDRLRVRLGGESGELLVETITTVAIMAIAFVAILGAVFTSIRIADYAGKSSSANTVVRAFAETMKEPTGTYAYVPCTTAGGTVTYPAWTPPSDYSQYVGEITQIRYLTGYVNGVPQWSNVCPATDLGAQELTLRATGPINDPAVKGTETVTITKRDARADL